MADQSFDIIIIGAGPGGYVAAIRASQLGFKTAIVERDYLGGICLNWGCIPTKALLRSAEIFHYLQHAKDYGLTRREASASMPRRWWSARARWPARLNGGVGFLMKKNKIAVIWGEATIEAPGKVVASRRPSSEAPKGALGARHLPGQAHHHRHRRAAARAARHRARREAGLDLLRGDGAAGDAEVAAGGRLGRHRHRVRLVLPHAGRGGDGGRGAAADPARRGRRDRRLRAQELREAGHQDPDRRQGDEARQEAPTASPPPSTTARAARRRWPSSA